MPAILRPSSHPRYKFEIVVSDPTRREANGRPKRRLIYFNDAAKARAEARRLNLSISAAGVHSLELTPAFRRDALEARALLDASGRPGVTLAETVAAWLRTQGAGPAARQLITPLLDACLDAKCRREGLSIKARDNIEYRVAAWLDREQIVTLGDITRERCLALSERPGVSAQTRRNDMAAVSSFLSWLVQEGALPANLLQGMRRPTAERRAPACYTAEQLRRLLGAATRYQGGKYARALGLLCLAGLRPSELTGTIVDLDHPTPAVRVSGGKLRGRANRIVLLRPEAAAWLRAQPAPAGRLALSRGPRQAIARLAGVQWIQDGARHTWISARLAISNDENATAREAGTSPDIIYRHYHRLMTAEAAREIDQLGAKPKK